MEKKSCFIIMPFTKTTANGLELQKKELNYIYNEVLRKVVLEYKSEKIEFFDVSRHEEKIGSLISGIVSNLNKADLVIADLTGVNPNVMYELGVRHSLKRGTIIITQDIDSLPSDLRDYVCVGYKFSTSTIDQKENYNSFKEMLHNAINEIFSTDKYDSPVLNYLNGKQKYWKEDELARLKENIIVGAYILDQYENIKKLLKEITEAENDKLFGLFGKFGALINNIGSAISDINIFIDDSIVYEDIHSAKQTISEIQKKQMFTDYLSNIMPSLMQGEDDVLERMKSTFWKQRYTDYFMLSNGEFCEISLEEIFSNDGDFFIDFISGFEKYLKTKALGLELSETDIDNMIK